MTLRDTAWEELTQAATGFDIPAGTSGTLYGVGDESPALTHLNTEQRTAAAFRGPAALVLAGAGSGKTRVMTARVTDLIRSGEARAADIVVTTFTRKAGGELRRRLATTLSDEEVAALTVGTFHSLGVRLVRAHAETLGLTEDTTVADERATESLMGAALLAVEQKPTDKAIRTALEMIDGERNRRVTQAWYSVTEQGGSLHNLMYLYTGQDLPPDNLYRVFHDRMLADRRIDFDSLGYLPVLLFLAHPAILAAYQTSWRHLLVDEFQDTSTVQLMLVRLLASTGDCSIFCVGDDAQSIYGWRGADIRNIQDFSHTFGGAPVFYLEQNYRSTPTIIAAANAILPFTGTPYPKRLLPNNPEGLPIQVLSCPSPEVEAKEVADKLLDMRAKGRIASWDEVYVLYRTNRQAEWVDDAFRRARIPCRIHRGTRFFDREEPRAILSPLLLSVNPYDGESFRGAAELIRLVQPGKSAPLTIAKKTVDSILEHALLTGRSGLAVARTFGSDLPGSASQCKAVHALLELVDAVQQVAEVDPALALQLVVERTGYRDRKVADVPDSDATISDLPEDELARKVAAAEARVASIDSLIALAGSFADSFRREVWENGPDRDGGAFSTLAAEARRAMPVPLRLFLDDIATLLEDPDPGPAEGVVNCLSIHAAKGLEAPVVAVIGCNEGEFPKLQRGPDGKTFEMDDEEARLFYVAITRAERYLLLTSSRARALRPGLDARSTQQARFLDWLPDATCVFRQR